MSMIISPAVKKYIGMLTPDTCERVVNFSVKQGWIEVYSEDACSHITYKHEFPHWIRFIDAIGALNARLVCP